MPAYRLQLTGAGISGGELTPGRPPLVVLGWTFAGVLEPNRQHIARIGWTPALRFGPGPGFIAVDGLAAADGQFTPIHTPAWQPPPVGAYTWQEHTSGGPVPLTLTGEWRNGQVSPVTVEGEEGRASVAI